MNPCIEEDELKERCKNPKSCIACFRVRDNVSVDEHHVCQDCRRGSTGMPRRLRAITLKNGKTYFVWTTGCGSCATSTTPTTVLILKTLC